MVEFPPLRVESVCSVYANAFNDDHYAQSK